MSLNQLCICNGQSINYFYCYSYDYLDEDDRQNGFPLFPLFCKQLSGQMQNEVQTFDYDKEYQNTQKLQYCS